MRFLSRSTFVSAVRKDLSRKFFTKKAFGGDAVNNGSFHQRGFCMCCQLPPLYCNSIGQSNAVIMAKSNNKLMSTTADSSKSIIDSILSNNKAWIEEKTKDDPDYFKKLGSRPQKPKVLYIGCSDSRVPPNELLGMDLGEIFVHRNLGNQVPGNDLNALSVIEYAVGHLGVTDIIVNGHYDCGAVKAACARQDLGLLEGWFRLIRDVYRLHRHDLVHFELIKDDVRKHNKLVELNVIEQCLNVYKMGVVQRKRIQNRQLLEQQLGKGTMNKEDIWPRIHGMVFNPHDGTLKKLEVDFAFRIGSLDHIYGLYEPPQRKQ